MVVIVDRCLDYDMDVGSKIDLYKAFVYSIFKLEIFFPLYDAVNNLIQSLSERSGPYSEITYGEGANPNLNPSSVVL